MTPNRCEEFQFRDADGNLIANRSNVARMVMRYDDQENVIEERYFAATARQHVILTASRFSAQAMIRLETTRKLSTSARTTRRPGTMWGSRGFRCRMTVAIT